MEITDEPIVDGENGGYPFSAELARLRTEAGAFMHRALEEKDDDDLQDEPQHVITPDYPWFTSTNAPMPPAQGESHRRPQALAVQEPLEHEIPHSGKLADACEPVWSRRNRLLGILIARTLRATRFDLRTPRTVAEYHDPTCVAFQYSTYVENTNELSHCSTSTTGNPCRPHPFGAFHNRHKKLPTTVPTQQSLVEVRKHHRLHPIQAQSSFQSTAMTSSAKSVPLPPATRQRTNPVKARSRSIQIKRSRRGSDADFSSSSVSASAEQMYDWATWRMYHRITTARRNKNSVAPLPEAHDSSSIVSSSRTYRGLSGFPHDGGNALYDSDFSPQKKTTANATPEKNDFDEGVFVMDL